MQPIGCSGILLVVEPGGKREMPKANYRFYAGSLESAGHLNVASDRVLIVDAGFWFYAWPRNAEAIVGDPDLFQSRKILLEVSPAEERIAFGRCLALLDDNIPI